MILGDWSSDVCSSDLESSIDTAEQLKEASVKGFTDDAHLADLVRQLIASMNE